jgi:hypothetical protein
VRPTAGSNAIARDRGEAQDRCQQLHMNPMILKMGLHMKLNCCGTAGC